MKKTITAVDLDEILARITPEMIEPLRASIAPTGYQDQLRAAVREGKRFYSAATGAKEEHHLPGHAIPDWLRLGTLDAFLQWASDKAQTCLHMPRPERPEPVFTAAWKPGLVVCARCMGLLTVADADADRTCDACGHLCAGPDAQDPVWPVSLWIGVLCFRAGVCQHCLPDYASKERNRLR